MSKLCWLDEVKNKRSSGAQSHQFRKNRGDGYFNVIKASSPADASEKETLTKVKTKPSEWPRLKVENLVNFPRGKKKKKNPTSNAVFIHDRCDG